MFKFRQKEVAAKDFYKQRQITDIFTIDVNKVVVSVKVSHNNGKDCHYAIECQVYGALIQLFIKTPKNILYSVMACHNTIKNSAYTMSFNVYKTREGVSQYKKIWNEVESQLFEKLATAPIKGEGKYIHGKLKMCKEFIKINFHGQDVPYDMYCIATAVLKIDSVYNQGKNYNPQVYIEDTQMQKTNNVTC